MKKINAEIVISAVIAELTVQYIKKDLQNVEKRNILKEHVMLKHLINIYHQLD